MKKEQKKQKHFITISRGLGYFCKFTPKVSKIQPLIWGPTNGDFADASILRMFDSIKNQYQVTLYN